MINCINTPQTVYKTAKTGRRFITLKHF